MRRRRSLAVWGLVLGTGSAMGQYSPPPSPVAPGAYDPGSPPRLSPPPVAPGAYDPGSPPSPVAPGAYDPGSPPQPENKFPINPTDVSLKRVNGSWQLWAGQRLLRDFGDRELDARDALRVYHDLRPTEWVTIGSPKPVVEYGLVNGRPPSTLGPPAGEDARNPAAVGTTASAGTGPAVTGAGARMVVPIDLRTVRVEAIRGVWCLRDDTTIHFNFGPSKADAEQALAVIRRYGFNRVGIVGQTTPVMSYLFVGNDPGPPPAPGPLAQAALQLQIDGLKRVGIPVPGVGYVGEMVRIDPRNLQVRKVGAEWVVASGEEVIGRFGPAEWAARDAARVISEGRFSEFCSLGSAGLTFFLVNGSAPNRVPFAVQGRRFDPTGLKVQPFGGGWAVTENGRHLFDCGSAEEGETIVRVMRHFGFNQLCHLGPTAGTGISFLAKVR